MPRPHADADVHRRGRTAAEVAAALAEREVAVWHGDYYAWELERHLALAPHGAVRAGFVHYNDEADAEQAAGRGQRPRLDGEAHVPLRVVAHAGREDLLEPPHAGRRSAPMTRTAPA